MAFVAFFLSFSSFAQVEVKDGASDSWNKEMFSKVSENPGFTSDYDIMVKESSIDVQVEGIYNITFTYGGVGSYALHMLGVELLDAEGNVIAGDTVIPAEGLTVVIDMEASGFEAGAIHLHSSTTLSGESTV